MLEVPLEVAKWSVGIFTCRFRPNYRTQVFTNPLEIVYDHVTPVLSETDFVVSEKFAFKSKERLPRLMVLFPKVLSILFDN